MKQSPQSFCTGAEYEHGLREQAKWLTTAASLLPHGWWQSCVGSKNVGSLVINHKSREIPVERLALLVLQMCLMGLAGLSVGAVDVKPGWTRTEQHMVHHMIGRPLLHHLSSLYLTYKLENMPKLCNILWLGLCHALILAGSSAPQSHLLTHWEQWNLWENQKSKSENSWAEIKTFY